MTALEQLRLASLNSFLPSGRDHSIRSSRSPSRVILWYSRRVSGGGLHITSRDASMDASVCRGISPWVFFVGLVSISPCIAQDQIPPCERDPFRPQGPEVSASSTVQTIAQTVQTIAQTVQTIAQTVQTIAQWCSRWIVHGPLMSTHPSMFIPSSDRSAEPKADSSASPPPSVESEETDEEQPILELPIAPPVPPCYQFTRRPTIHLVLQPDNCG
jgi:hypothetical protein